MHIGVTLRNMGPQSAAEIFTAGAREAEARGFESVWITDHIAIPPDDAEGSGGRYLDPLVSLGVLAGHTKSIKLGTGVLILPYRPPLPTAKQVATLQELSDHRLLLGVGIGWMDPEFRALGLDRHQRGRASDATLQFINDCFANEVVEPNGQPMLFKPRPPKPPILIGGRAPHALKRAARYGDGWLPMVRGPEDLDRWLDEYRAECTAAGRPAGRITAMGGVPLDDTDTALAQLSGYLERGVERFVCGIRYDTLDEYAAQLDRLAELQTRVG